MSPEILEALIELTDILSHQGNIEKLVELTVQKAKDMLQAKHALIMMVNPNTGDTVKTIFRKHKEPDGEAMRLLRTNVSGWVTLHDRSFLSPDIRQDERFRIKAFRKLPVKSVLCAPLRTEGTIMGTILLLDKVTDKEFTEMDRQILEGLAGVVAPYLRIVMQTDFESIARYFRQPLPNEELLEKFRPFGLLGKSFPFLEMLQLAQAAAESDVRVLLEGESGTGKGVLAKAIHYLSDRKDAPFVSMDCGTLVPTLIESELFGYKKGAFTGADRDHNGLIQQADGGTLFIDEITNLPLASQSKLLTFLQEGEIRQVGGDQSIRVNVRVIAATNVPLKNKLQAGKFRHDLFYRLRVYPISVPSLEERREDIPLLANHFLAQTAQKENKKARRFHHKLLQFMVHRKWPGNIRELESFVERLVALAPREQEVLGENLLQGEILEEYREYQENGESYELRLSLDEQLARYESRLIRQALEQCHWNQSEAARRLQISEQRLRYRMKKLNIHRPDTQSPRRS